MAFSSRIARILLTVLMFFAGPPALSHPAPGALGSVDGHTSASSQSAVGVVPFARSDTNRHAQMQPDAPGCCGIACHIVLLASNGVCAAPSWANDLEAPGAMIADGVGSSPIERPPRDLAL